MTSAFLISQLQSIWDSNSQNFKEFPKDNLDFVKKFCNVMNSYYLTMQTPMPIISNPLYLTAQTLLAQDLLKITNNRTLKENISSVLEKFHRKIMTGVDSLGLYNTLNLLHLDLISCFNYKNTATKICTDFGLKYDTWVHKTYSIQTHSHVTFFWK